MRLNHKLRLRLKKVIYRAIFVVSWCSISLGLTAFAATTTANVSRDKTVVKIRVITLPSLATTAAEVTKTMDPARVVPNVVQNKNASSVIPVMGDAAKSVDQKKVPLLSPPTSSSLPVLQPPITATAPETQKAPVEQNPIKEGMENKKHGEAHAVVKSDASSMVWQEKPAFHSAINRYDLKQLLLEIEKVAAIRNLALELSKVDIAVAHQGKPREEKVVEHIKPETKHDVAAVTAPTSVPLPVPPPTSSSKTDAIVVKPLVDNSKKKTENKKTDVKQLSEEARKQTEIKQLLQKLQNVELEKQVLKMQDAKQANRPENEIEKERNDTQSIVSQVSQQSVEPEVASAAKPDEPIIIISNPTSRTVTAEQ